MVKTNIAFDQNFDVLGTSTLKAIWKKPMRSRTLHYYIISIDIILFGQNDQVLYVKRRTKTGTKDTGQLFVNGVCMNHKQLQPKTKQ
jgi:hypothetical protein